MAEGRHFPTSGAGSLASEIAARADTIRDLPTEADVETATGVVRDEVRGIEAARGRLVELERELNEAERARKALSDKQRVLLDRIAASDAAVPPGSTRTSLQRRGLIEPAAGAGTGPVAARMSGRYALTEAGRGIDAPRIFGELSQQRTIVAELAERAESATSRALEADRRSAQEESRAAVEQADQVQRSAISRRRNVRPARVPALRDLSRENEQLMRDYLQAAQSGQERKARALRKQLTAAKVLGEDPIGGAGVRGIPSIGYTTKPELGTQRWVDQVRKEILDNPRVRFTPDPTRLQSEIRGLLSAARERPNIVQTTIAGGEGPDAAISEVIRSFAERRIAEYPPELRTELTRRGQAVQDAARALQEYNAPQQGYEGQRPLQTALQRAESSLYTAVQVAERGGGVPELHADEHATRLRGIESRLRSGLLAETPAGQLDEMQRLVRELDNAEELVNLIDQRRRAYAHADPQRRFSELRRLESPQEGRRDLASQLDRAKNDVVVAQNRLRAAESDQRYKVEGAYGRYRIIDQAADPRSRQRQLPGTGTFRNERNVARRVAEENERAARPGIREPLVRQLTEQIDQLTQKYQHAESAVAAFDRRAEQHNRTLAEQRQAAQQIEPPPAEGAAPPPPRPPARPPAPPAPEPDDEPERRRRAEEEKTRAVEEGTQRRIAASNEERNRVAGNTAEFERLLRDHTDEVQRNIEAHREYERLAQEGRAPAVGTPEFEAAAVEERRLAAAKERIAIERTAPAPRDTPYRPGALVPRTPAFAGALSARELQERTIGQYGQPGPQFGAYPYAPLARRQLAPSDRPGAREERVTATIGPRTPLTQAIAEYEAAQRAAAKSARELRNLRSRADKVDVDELREAERVHQLNRQRVETARFSRASVQGSLNAELNLRREAEAQRQQLVQLGRQAQGQRLLPAPYQRPDIIEHPTEFGRRVPGPFPSPSDVVNPAYFERIRRAEERAARRAQPDFIEGTATDLPPEDPVEAARQRRREQRRARALGAAPVTHDDRLRAVFGDDEDAINRVTRAMGGATRAGDEFDAEQQRLRRTVAISGDQMRRHGLLTTEFLNAMRDGRVTVREMGTQIGGTILKFAGWTTAASATYGALAAIQQLGAGALAASQGVTSLQRVAPNIDRTATQQQFRAQAHQFNLPITDVAAASYESAKAFRDQGDIAKATAAALYGVKIGELAAGDAARYLTATVRGFNLTANDLADVEDTINQLQNRFGVSFGETAKGVAAAAGAFGAAGGSVKELTAFIATGQLVTGRTGSEIGTVLRRTAEQIRRPQRRQTILETLGIDPQTASVTDVIQRAQQAVRQGADVGVVARAITTPELASRGLIAILRSQALYHRVVAEAARSHGSAERELNTLLGGVGEQIKRVGVNLQTLGAAFAEAGVLTPMQALLGVLNQVLRRTEDLVSVFNVLPAPIRAAGASIVQLLAGFALLRRFDVGGALGLEQRSAVGRLLNRNPARLQRAQVLQGLQDELDFIVPERQRATRGVARSHGALGRQGDEVARLGAIAAAEGTDDAYRATDAASRRLQRLEERHSELVREAEELEARHVELVNARNQYRRTTTRRAGGDPIAEAERLNIAYASPIEPRPDPGGPIPIGEQNRVRTAGARAAERDAVGLRAAFAAAYADSIRTRTAAPNVRYGIRGAAEAGTAGIAAGTAAATGAAAGRAGAAASRIGGAARGFAAGAGRVGTALVGALGPIDLAIAGLITTYALVKTAQAHAEEQARKLRAVRGAAGIDDLEKARREVEKISGVPDRPAPRQIPVAGKGAPSGLADYQQRSSELGQEAQRQYSEIDRISRLQLQGRGFSLRELRAQYQEAGRTPAAAREVSQRARYGRGLVVAQDRLRTAERAGEPEAKLTPLRAAVQKAQQDIDVFVEQIRNDQQDLKATRGEYDRNLSVAQLAAANTVRLFTRGPDRRLLRGNRQVIATQLRDALRNTDPAAQGQQLDAIQSEQQRVQEALQQRLERGVAHARTPAAAGRLRRRYVRQVRQLTVAPVRDNIAEQVANINRLTAQVADQEAAVQSAAARLTQRPTRSGASLLARERQQLGNLRRALRNANGFKRLLFALLGIKQADLKQIADEEAAAQADEADQAFEARTNRLVAEAGPQRGPQVAADRAKKNVARVRGQVKRGVPGRNQASVDNAIANSINTNEDLKQQEDGIQRDLIGEFQARQGLAAARFAGGHRDDGARLRFAASQAQQLVGFIRSQGKTGAGQDNYQAYIGALQSAQEARNSLADYIRDEAKALQDARFAVQESLTDDPVKLARIHEREANAHIRRAEKPSERVDAQAERNRAIAERRQAIADRRIEDLDVQHDIGKLTDEAYIRGLQRIERTLKRGSDARRQLHNRILRLKHDSENESEVSLDVGSIRLPTIYDVRRLARQGTTGPNVSHTVVVNASVRNDSDLDALGGHLERIVGGSVRSGMRSAGLRG